MRVAESAKVKDFNVVQFDSDVIMKIKNKFPETGRLDIVATSVLRKEPGSLGLRPITFNVQDGQ